MSHSLATKTDHINKNNNKQHASIVRNKEEDKEWNHSSLPSSDNNNNNVDGKELHYGCYYKCIIITISFLVLMASFGIGNSW